MDKVKKTFFQSIFTSREIISSVNNKGVVDENIEKQMLELLKNNSDSNNQEDEYDDIMQMFNMSKENDLSIDAEVFDEDRNSALIEKLNSESGILSINKDIYNDAEEEGGFNSENIVPKNVIDQEAEFLVKTVTNDVNFKEEVDNTVVFNADDFKNEIKKLEKSKEEAIDSNVDIPLM